MGGKTGTAEKEQDRSKISPSFFCFGPVDRPRALVLVVVDEPGKGRFAAQIAAPTAARLLGTVLDFLQVEPDRPDELDLWSWGGE
jgi:cell division protein FtsI/penicillin-binding protein 2